MLFKRIEISETSATGAASPSLRCDFDAFLYATIGEVDDEMPFSVLSALARQNVDPWEEAAKLAKLPRESAILRLTSLISAATVNRSPGTAPAATAARLVDLLPKSDRFAIPSFGQMPEGAPRNFTPLLIYIIVGALILASALLGN
jgi:hypothetical protein